MFRDTYKSYNKNIVPSDELISKTIEKVNKEKIAPIRKYRKTITIAAVFLVMILLAVTPVIATQYVPIYNIIYKISPSVAQFFSPVNMSSTSNNVKMDVLATYVHGNTMEIYITMQDLTGKRFKNSVDLNDSYSINTSFDNTSHCRLVEYDDTTNTATFLISIVQWNNKDISGDKITFTLREALSDKKVYSCKIPIDLSKVTTVKETQEVYLNGGSLSETQDYATALIPGEPYEEFPVDGVELTRIGFIDNRLHVQYAVRNPSEHNNYGNFHLFRPNGKPTQELYVSDTMDFNDFENDIFYHEDIFDISRKEIADSKLCCEFHTTSARIEGNWKVTFPIENKGKYTLSEESEIHYSTSEVDLTDIEIMNIGAEMPSLMYADENIVIFEGNCGIITYDLKSKMIIDRLSTEYLRKKGISLVNAHTSIDGDTIYISDAMWYLNGDSSTGKERLIYEYDVYLRKLSKISGETEAIFPRKVFGFKKKDQKYIDHTKLVGYFKISRENDFIFLQADTDWSMKSLQIVICEYGTGKKDIIDVFK